MSFPERFPELETTLRQARKYTAPSEGHAVQFFEDVCLVNGEVRDPVVHVQYRPGGTVVLYVDTADVNDLRAILQVAQETNWKWIETQESVETAQKHSKTRRAKQLLRFSPQKEIDVVVNEDY